MVIIHHSYQETGVVNIASPDDDTKTVGSLYRGDSPKGIETQRMSWNYEVGYVHHIAPMELYGEIKTENILKRRCHGGVTMQTY